MSTLKQSAVLALSAAILLPGTLMAAELTNPSKVRKEAVQLTQHIERTSLQIQKEADRLHSMSRSGQISNESHRHVLQKIKNHVNEELQPAFGRLAELKPHLPEWHQTAIDQMKTSAASMALNAEAAIENRNAGGPRILAMADENYKQYVANIYDRASVLAEVADATEDYGTAQLKGHQAGLAIASHN